MRTHWRLILEMPCDDLISAQPQMHHSWASYSMWLFLVLLQRLNTNSGGLLIKGFMNCLKSTKHKNVPHITHFCNKCTQYGELTNSIWRQQCVAIGLLLMKCFYAAVSRGLQKTKSGNASHTLSHHLWFMPNRNSWLGVVQSTSKLLHPTSLCIWSKEALKLDYIHVGGLFQA